MSCLMIEFIIISLLSLCFIFVSYLLVLSLRRINQFETFIINVQQVIEYATERIKQVDSLGHYEADDETGFFFYRIKTITRNT